MQKNNRLILAVSSIYLSGCSAIYEGGQTYTDDNDMSGLFAEITNTQFHKSNNYQNRIVTKHDVSKKWGAPISININGKSFGGMEYWIYEKELSFSTLFVTPLHIPIAIWPSGYYKTQVVFRGDVVASVIRQNAGLVYYPSLDIH